MKRYAFGLGRIQGPQEPSKSMQRIRIVPRCSECQHDYVIYVNRFDYVRWQAGAKIQDVMSYLSADERELLISGICGKCFDEIFGGDDV